MAEIRRDFIRRPPAKGCWGCDLFDLEVGCSVKLQNPKTYTQTKGIIENQGLGAICNFNPFKVFIYDKYHVECYDGQVRLMFVS